MKKLLALVLAALMVLSLAACGGGSGNDGGSSKPADGGSQGGSETADIDTSEHVVINYMTTGDKPQTGANDEMLAMVNKLMTEKINAEINIYWISWTDYLANYNLTLARMDGSVDMIGSSTDWLDAWPNAKNGAFLELSEEMLQKYCPQTWASIPAEHWEPCKFNDVIWFIPEDHYSQWTNHGFMYRLDWAREAGLADGVKSWEDMNTYVHYVKDTYGDELVAVWDIDGGTYTAGGYISSKKMWTGIDGIGSGALWGAYSDDPYTVKCVYLEETDLLVEYAKMMQEWNAIGVWPTDVLSNTGADNATEFRQGLTAMNQHHTQTWTFMASPKSSTDNLMYEKDKDAEVGFFYWGMENKNVRYDRITHGVCAVSAASKNPERTLMAYDLLRNDPEIYHLFNYGIEGRSYAVDENGYRYRPDTYDADKDSISTNWWWGRNDDLEIRSADMNWPVIDALYEEYKSFATLYPYEQYVPDLESVQSYIDNCGEVYTTYMKQICYGQYSVTAEEIVKEFQDKLRAAGAETVQAKIQEQITATYGE
jgi:ABC-type glycerol-3-phosphate transport system substrate-binding protein